VQQQQQVTLLELAQHLAQAAQCMQALLEVEIQAQHQAVVLASLQYLPEVP
jgi:hypothetical protein